MDHYIARIDDITIENDLGATNAFGIALPATTMSQERYLKRLRSICFQQGGADTYALGKYFDSLFTQLAAKASALRSDGEHHAALVAAAKAPQGLFNGNEITQVGPFQRAIVEAGTEPPPAPSAPPPPAPLPAAPAAEAPVLTEVAS